MFEYFYSILIEGKTYEISNFVVKYYEETEIFKCFEDTKYIILSNLTKISIHSGTRDIIPQHVWKFTNLAAINGVNEGPRNLIGKTLKMYLFPHKFFIF